VTIETSDTIDRSTISGTGPYNYSFRIFSENELAVSVDTGELNPVPLSLTTHYSVSDVNDEDGGTITLTAATASLYATHTLDIRSNTVAYQPTSIRNQGAFLPEVHEEAFDRLARQVQDLSRRVDQKFGYPDNVTLSASMVLRSEWAERWVYVNADGVIEPAAAITPQALSPTIIGQLIWPRTASEIALGITPTNYRYTPGNIRRYGAAVDGVTEDAAAFRHALDVAAYDGTTVRCEPAGSIKLNSTVYIPQSGGFNSENGFEMSLYGCVIIGQGNGVGTVFETGTGSLSTGGATNFGEPNESAGSLHLGCVIKGARFRSFGTALRVFNFVQGCSLRDLWFEDGDVALYAFRSFYMTMFNCVGRLTTTDAVFNFDTECNLITLTGCSALGIGGVGWLFEGGVKGLVMNNCGAEGSVIGIQFTGQVLGAAIRGCYVEGNTTGIDLGSSPKVGMNIDENYFVLNTTDITGDNWQSGLFGAGNVIEDAPVVDLGGNGNYNVVVLSSGAYPETGAGNHTNWTNVPTGWTLNEAIEVVHNDFIYQAATGTQALLARMEPVHSANRVVAFKYAGHGGPLGVNIIPFCTTSLQNADDDLRIDTKIDYGAGACAMFDVQVNDSIGQFNVSGRVVFSNVVYRDDATAKTVTASSNAGFLRLTLGGFNNITSYTGSVRLV